MDARSPFLRPKYLGQLEMLWPGSPISKKKAGDALTTSNSSSRAIFSNKKLFWDNTLLSTVTQVATEREFCRNLDQLTEALLN
jgi:hypothetical protein